MNKETSIALQEYTKSLVPAVLDILEAANCNPKLCSSLRSTIYSKRDSFILMNSNLEARTYEPKN